MLDIFSNSILKCPKKTIVRYAKYAFYGYIYEKRTRWALVLIIISPMLLLVYKLFPADGYGEYLINTDWIVIKNTIETFHLGKENGSYYPTISIFVFDIARTISSMSLVLGGFMLFSRNNLLRFIFMVPLISDLSELAYKLFFVNDYETYTYSIQIKVIVSMAAAIFVIIFISNRFLKKTHEALIIIDNEITSIVVDPSTNWSEKKKLLKEAKNEWHYIRETNEVSSQDRQSRMPHPLSVSSLQKYSRDHKN